MNYAFDFTGHGVFTPDGKAEISDVDAHNKQLESVEIEWLKTHPNNLFLYVKQSKPDADWSISTWLGTIVSTGATFGPRRNIGFGYHTYRRAVSARIFGVLYHGWYFESSGNYCRLRKAKNQ
jgi:hypothetical protein